ncbi:MAG: pyridoxamine 5'-phosphate oxidase [Polyangiales bacterium]
MTLHDPVARFQALWDEASRDAPFDASACTLATQGLDDCPNARVVLLKGVDPKGYQFFSNYQSCKGEELARLPQAALCCYWPWTGVQVRVRGGVARLDAAASQGYFATRPRGSQLGAWASAQSAPLADRDALIARLRDVEARFGAGEVPCPPHWGGYRLRPEEIEFWFLGDSRLHHREQYRRTDASWSHTLLHP